MESNINKAVVKAYGKILVFGGYGILEDGTGLVVNVNKGTTATVSFNDKDKIITPYISDQSFVKTALDSTMHYLRNKKNLKINVVNDTELNPGSKAGFGSSATSVVSVIAAILGLYGQDICSEEGRKLVYRLSQNTHYKVQGSLGSGFDISAACFGTQFFSSKGYEKTSWPDWCSVLAFTGVSASTRSLVKKVFGYREKDKETYYKLINVYNEVNLDLVKLYNRYLEKKDNLEEFISKLEKSQLLRKELGQKADVPIETYEQTNFLKNLKKQGALFAVLPGAGFADTILAVCDSKIKRKNLMKYLKSQDYSVFDNVNIIDKPYEKLSSMNN